MVPEPDKPAETELSVDDPNLPDASGAAIAFSAAIAVLAAVFFVQSLSIDSDAEIWPKTLSAILFLLAAGQLARSLAMRLRQGTEALSAGLRQRVGPRVITAIWLVAFAVVAKLTGFGIATLLFVPVYMLQAGIRSPVLIVLVTAFTAGAITYLFGTLIGVPIWEGRL